MSVANVENPGSGEDADALDGPRKRWISGTGGGTLIDPHVSRRYPSNHTLSRADELCQHRPLFDLWNYAGRVYSGREPGSGRLGPSFPVNRRIGIYIPSKRQE